MFEDDYIIRMIEQMGDILRKVFMLENKQEFKACHEELDVAMKKIGLPRLLARTMPAVEITRLIRRPGGADDDRCLLLARLIAADAHVYKTEGKCDVAHNLYATSLGILTELQKDAEGEKLERIEKDMDAVRLYISENIHDNGNLGL